MSTYCTSHISAYIYISMLLPPVGAQGQAEVAAPAQHLARAARHLPSLVHQTQPAVLQLDIVDDIYLLLYLYRVLEGPSM